MGKDQEDTDDGRENLLENGRFVKVGQSVNVKYNNRSTLVVGKIITGKMFLENRRKQQETGELKQ